MVFQNVVNVCHRAVSCPASIRQKHCFTSADILNEQCEVAFVSACVYKLQTSWPSKFNFCLLTLNNENIIFSISATDRETLREEVMKVGLPLANYKDEPEHVEADEEEPASKRS